MKKIFVSGCYDILHAGHVQFFNEAKALGDHLTVCFASDEVLWHHKQRRSSIPQEHKLALIKAFNMVDDVVIGTNHDIGLDFKDHFLRIKPDILAVTEDDKYSDLKKDLCLQTGTKYYVLPKTPPEFPPVSTTKIVKWIRAPHEAPLRVDFAGGWLDVPRFSRDGGFIVNCAISPLVSLKQWIYERCSGLGGSGAWALLNGDDGVTNELNLGVGWQDPAIIQETGLCVWKSGLSPQLSLKRNGEMLNGLMAIRFTDQTHDTPGNADKSRNYDLIYKAGKIAADAVISENMVKLAEAVNLSYKAQLEEGMAPLELPNGCVATKYCGGGWGGYALLLFSKSELRDEFMANYTKKVISIEPFVKTYKIV